MKWGFGLRADKTNDAPLEVPIALARLDGIFDGVVLGTNVRGGPNI